MDEPKRDNPETVAPVPSPNTVIAPVVNTTANAADSASPQAPTEAAIPQTQQAAVALSESTPASPLAETEETSPSTDTDSQSITWTASEFYNHQKSAGWYLMLVIVTIAVAAILYLWTKSIITPTVVVISSIMLGTYGARRPGQLEYLMNSQGIRIGSKQYRYDDFRLFVVTTELTLPEITLVPVKRFMPSLSVRYTPEIENKVFTMLSNHLPFEERRPDFIDSLMHRIHF
jgi:hypothetical protein